MRVEIVSLYRSFSSYCSVVGPETVYFINLIYYHVQCVSVKPVSSMPAFFMR